MLCIFYSEVTLSAMHVVVGGGSVLVLVGDVVVAQSITLLHYSAIFQPACLPGSMTDATHTTPRTLTHSHTSNHFIINDL